MPRQYKTSKELDKILQKLEKKDKQLLDQLLNKMNEVISSPDIDHYKNLRYNLKEYRKIHNGHFVLVFKYDKENNIVYFTDFDHHDNIYAKIR